MFSFALIKLNDGPRMRNVRSLSHKEIRLGLVVRGPTIDNFETTTQV